MSQCDFKKVFIERTIDNIIKQLEHYKCSQLNETDFPLFDEILQNKINELSNVRKMKKTMLNNDDILNTFNSYVQNRENMYNIFNYIINNYEPLAYKNYNFIIAFKTEDGKRIESFRIEGNDYQPA